MDPFIYFLYCEYSLYTSPVLTFCLNSFYKYMLLEQKEISKKKKNQNQFEYFSQN